MTIFSARSASRIGAEEEAGCDVDIGRRWRPFLALDRVAVENRPDRAAAIVAVADPGQCGIDEIIGIALHVLGVEIAALHIGIDRIVVVGDVLPPGLVIEALAQHIDQDEVLPVRHPQAAGASAVEYRAARHPLQMPVIVLASDRSRPWSRSSRIRRSGCKSPTVMRRSPWRRARRWHPGRTTACRRGRNIPRSGAGRTCGGS